jgi:hypothetical protein
VDPYRPLHVVDYEPAREDDGLDHEEGALAVLLVVLGLARVIPAVCVGEAFGAEATIALLMLIAGLGLMVRHARAATRLSRKGFRKTAFDRRKPCVENASAAERPERPRPAPPLE